MSFLSSEYNFKLIFHKVEKNTKMHVHLNNDINFIPTCFIILYKQQNISEVL